MLYFLGNLPQKQIFRVLPKSLNSLSSLFILKNTLNLLEKKNFLEMHDNLNCV
jgi:hypothetical protein